MTNFCGLTECKKNDWPQREKAPGQQHVAEEDRESLAVELLQGPAERLPCPVRRRPDKEDPEVQRGQLWRIEGASLEPLSPEDAEAGTCPLFSPQVPDGA
jgi:hypothetical protein